MADEVLLLPIYPARELPIEGVTSEIILKRMTKAGKRLVTEEEMLQFVRDEYVHQMGSSKGQVLVMAGAGNIDAMVA